MLSQSQIDKIKENMQGQRNSKIPGLFSSDLSKNTLDWTSDSTGQEQSVGQDVMESDTNLNTSNTQNNSMIMLGGNSLLADLNMEKQGLDSGYVHSHRLLDQGKLTFQLMHT